MDKYSKYFETNRGVWDSKTQIHAESKFYDMEGFLAGINSLRKIELSELPDVTGKSVFHSQCHFGQDTLSLERMGARCTAIDFSEKAINKAKSIRDQLGLKSRFIVSNVYEIGTFVTDKFDIVFTSYGVIGWLPDLDRWAHQLMSRLKPGGIFYMVEFHPVLYMYDWKSRSLNYPYFNTGEVFEETVESSYTETSGGQSYTEYFWQHSLSELIQALLDHGLRLESFKEFDYSPYNCFENMELRAEQEYVYSPGGEVTLPHVFSLKGRKE